MTIETLIPLDEIPPELQAFDRSLMEYVKTHKLSSMRKLSEEHLTAIQKLAADHGIIMERDGTARFPAPTRQ